MAELKRSLGVTECIFFGVGSILGAGIYTLIGKVAGWSGTMIWVPFLIASITAVLTAFSYAELSAMFPRAGGEYVYAKEAFGKKTGIILGTIISLNGIVSGATVSIGFAGYFNQLLGTPVMIAAIGIIILLFLINVSGIKESSTINIVFTIIEAAGLFFIIYAAAGYVGKVNYFELPDAGLQSLMTASALAFFAYIGLEEIVKLAEETKQPEKNIPKALFASSAIVMIIYLLVAICAVSAVDYKQLQESKSPLADIAGNTFGNTGIIIISIIALFSTSNTILSNMLGSSRVLLNMSKENKILNKLSYVSPKRKTPVSALILILIVMTGFALIGDIEIIARITTLLIFITFIAVNIAAIVLRIKKSKTKRPFRIPLNINNIPVTAVLGILLTLILFYYNLRSLAEGSG